MCGAAFIFLIVIKALPILEVYPIPEEYKVLQNAKINQQNIIINFNLAFSLYALMNAFISFMFSCQIIIFQLNTTITVIMIINI